MEKLEQTIYGQRSGHTEVDPHLTSRDTNQTQNRGRDNTQRLYIHVSTNIIYPIASTQATWIPRRPLTPYIFATKVGLILPQLPTDGPTYHKRRTTPRLPYDDTLPQQKTPASPEQHIILIPYSLFSPTEHTDTT